ncbi:Hypothetical predicted protein [Cloeon dipterum]|uniref:C-type lectin domain-containing protein n=1 Tax=Cloeon dipterum TaxID=197152 RepID=A0A8S1DRI9_9INSE|nr:Hypothetical predicted protein [Cloeon dipterum]
MSKLPLLLVLAAAFLTANAISLEQIDSKLNSIVTELGALKKDQSETKVSERLECDRISSNLTTLSNGKKYWIPAQNASISLSWYKAKEMCEKNAMRLASPKTSEELELLSQKAASHFEEDAAFWLSASDVGQQPGDLRWHGGDVLPRNSHLWFYSRYVSEPDVNSQFTRACVYAKPSAKLYDAPCGASHLVLCQQDDASHWWHSRHSPVAVLCPAGLGHFAFPPQYLLPFLTRFTPAVTMATRGKWCFFCDKWVKNDLLDRSRSSKTDEDDEVEEYWKLHEKSLAHLTKKRERGEFPNVTWDGHTIYASFAAGEKTLDFQKMSWAMRKHGYTTRVNLIDNDAYIVGFRDQIGAEKALTNQDGNIITRPIFKIAPKAAKKPVPRLDSSDSWEAQAKQLAVAFKLAVTPEVEEQHHKQREHILTDIVTAFQPLCRKVDCFVYGSRATGLADIDSDIDVHIKLDYADCDFEKPLSKESHEKLLRAAVKLLRRKPLVFSNTYFVLAARVPVLHFLHNPTNVECDVTFKNMLGVHNSQFLRFISAQDERIFLLFFLVKRWRKAHQLQMSNYCFTMLAILFLQTLPQPLLPPILQLKGDADRLVLEQGWVCGFSTKRIANHNRSSLKQLTIAFFGFLARLDFGVDVICPMTASTVEKWRFLRAETLPEEMQGLARLDKKEGLLVKKPVCVQDPFELNHNVAKNLGAKDSTEFTTFCAKLAEYCELKTNLSIEDLLKFSPSCEGVKLQDNSFTQKIFLQNYFPADFELLKSKSIRELWFEDVVRVIYDLFKDVLNCAEERGMQMDSPPRKVQKIPGKSERLAAWTFSTRTMLFSGRKKQQVNVKACYFIREAMTSRVMINNSDSVSREFLTFNTELTPHVKPTYVEVHLRNVGSAVDSFHSLCCFLDKNLQGMVEKSLASPYQKLWQALNRGCFSLEEQLDFLSVQAKKTPRPAEESNPFLEAIEKVNDGD